MGLKFCRTGINGRQINIRVYRTECINSFRNYFQLWIHIFTRNYHMKPKKCTFFWNMVLRYEATSRKFLENYRYFANIAAKFPEAAVNFKWNALTVIKLPITQESWTPIYQDQGVAMRKHAIAHLTWEVIIKQYSPWQSVVKLSAQKVWLSQHICEAWGQKLQRKGTFPDPQGNW